MTQHDFKYLGRNTDIRLNSEQIEIGRNVVVDDGVRIVVPQNGRLIINDNVKIGIGTVLNCGGSLVIEPEVSLYGYCYVQTSRWHWSPAGKKEYTYFSITLGLRTTLAPYTTIAGNVVTPSYFESLPNQIVGEW